MALVTKTADSLPTIARRGGRNSEEKRMLQENLQSGQVHFIEGVHTPNEFNALQQRIRTAANDLGMKATIRTQPAGTVEVDGVEVKIVDLYFCDSALKDQLSTPKVEEAPKKAPAKAKATK